MLCLLRTFALQLLFSDTGTENGGSFEFSAVDRSESGRQDPRLTDFHDSFLTNGARKKQAAG